jgi:hypothetical protein
VLLELKSEVFSNIALPFFNGFVYKFLDMAAINADQVVMMLSLIELIDSPAIPFAGFEMAAQKQASLFKLGKNPINSG